MVPPSQPPRRSNLKVLSVTSPANGSIASPRSILRPPSARPTASTTTTTTNVALSAAASIGEAAWAASAEVDATWVREQKNSSNNQGLAARVALLASRLSSLQSFVAAEFSLLTAEALSLAEALKTDDEESER
jgi:hypothetical protein